MQQRMTTYCDTASQLRVCLKISAVMFTVRITLFSGLCPRQSAETKVKLGQDSFRKVSFLQRSKCSWIRRNFELFFFKR